MGIAQRNIDDPTSALLKDPNGFLHLIRYCCNISEAAFVVNDFAGP
jgi:hypothetical protein